MKNSNKIDKLQNLCKKGKWSKFFTEALVNLEHAKKESDQSAIDVIFRFMRGAVFLLSNEYEETENKKNNNPVCSACGVDDNTEKLVGFANGFICEECSKLISMAFKDA